MLEDYGGVVSRNISMAENAGIKAENTNQKPPHRIKHSKNGIPTVDLMYHPPCLFVRSEE